MNKPLRIALGVLLGFLAANAMPVGVLFVVRPDGSAIGMTPAMLERGPFDSYLIPGVFLFLLGAWHAAAVVAVVRARPRAWLVPALAGLGACVWILVQVTIVQLSWLQPFIFAIGLAELVLALVWRARVTAPGGRL